MKKRLLPWLLLFAGLALWLGRRSGSEPASEGRSASLDRGKTPAAVAGTGRSRESERDAESLRRLLGRTTDLLERIGRLSADDTDEFAEIARLTNEFENDLDACGFGQTGNRRMPPNGFPDSLPAPNNRWRSRSFSPCGVPWTMARPPDGSTPWRMSPRSARPRRSCAGCERKAPGDEALN
jgi:hypothetical protein